MLTAQGLAGVLTIAFALGSLRPALTVAGQRSGVGPWLIAASFMGVGNISDAFFRLDCRAADPDCTVGASLASWHSKVHLFVGLAGLLITLAAPFVLMRRLRTAHGWRGLYRPTRAVGISLIVALVVSIALGEQTGHGLAQRAMGLIACGWISALAAHVLRMDVSIHEHELLGPP